MPHWLEHVLVLLRADTSDLRALAKLAGGDPRTFYRGARLCGADIRGQDLRGMEFTDIDVATIKYDENTKLDFDLRPRVSTPPESKMARSAHLLATSAEIIQYGDELLEQRLYSEAVEVFEVGVERYPNEEAIHVGLITSLTRCHRPVLAWNACLTALKTLEVSEAVYQAASRVAGSSENISDAIEILSRGALLFPENRRIAVQRARLIASISSHEAVSAFTEVLDRWPTADIISSLAEALARSGQTELLIDVLEKHARKVAISKNAAARLSKIIFHDMRTLADIGARLEAIAIKSPDEPTVRFMSAMLSELKEFDREIRVLEHAGAADPTVLVFKKQYSRAMKNVGRIDELVDLLRMTLANHPEEVGPYKWLTDALAFAGRRNEAIQLFEAAREKFGLKTAMKKWGIRPDPIQEQQGGAP